MTRFSQTVSVVTGAGSGIGEYTAIRLANEGSKVILVGRTRSKLERVANKINETSKIPTADLFVADVTSEEDVNELAAFIEGNYGNLHIVVNNAGGSLQSKILETTSQDWDLVQETNLKSVFLVSKALGKVMVDASNKESDDERRDRSIVNIASLSGHKAGSHIPHYSSAKAAVINFTRALALELAPHGIRVNSVSPGFVETPLTEQGLQNEHFVEAIKRSTALRRVGRPEEIANIITFVASQEASYMTGSDVLADGGWLIK
ncbi:SDR family NAD(P)-dependent oxidoreductase [Cytobacillus sp. S13-E01]|uniref:SDR family NAD(P)-dependent oxidoreductase n=1 Tax=Cytobacillus sp. S13-E01 TaxID=3031326 RepID=UPI0023D7E19C|nr:SDR family oxidoreductase [Cytobacillus sp. S13-E01]MDF0725418.1 SDR family NAD(P)-dependent oxidoreductase [Cytobacillus sp. S13-E01]